MSSILNYVILDNTVFHYLFAILVFLIAILFIRFFVRGVIRQFNEHARKTPGFLDNFVVSLLERIAFPYLHLWALFAALKILNLPPSFEKALNYTGLAVSVFFVARFITMLSSFGLRTYLLRRGETDAVLEKSLKGILIVIQVLVWSGAIIFFLDNLGFKVSAVIAGLGVGGIAVALAAQTLLKDLFSYFSIIFDRPFKVGDFIIIDDYMGTIEYIGIKTTRVRSLSGELLVFPNSNLTDARLRNYQIMETRRIEFRFNVVYKTGFEQLKEIPKIVESIIRSIKDVKFDRAHFKSFGESFLVFEVVYIVLSSDYNKYMDLQQEINFRIKEELDKRDIHFATPSRHIYLHKTWSEEPHPMKHNNADYPLKKTV